MRSTQCLSLSRRALVSSGDPRERFLRAVARELRCRPLMRRRVCQELAAHLDDDVAELRALGLPRAAALQEALRRLGDPETIAAAFSVTRSRRARWWRAGRLRSPAWIAVGAMTLVTAWAAELPQASGAKSRVSCAATSAGGGRTAPGMHREGTADRWRQAARSRCPR